MDEDEAIDDRWFNLVGALLMSGHFVIAGAVLVNDEQRWFSPSMVSGGESSVTGYVPAEKVETVGVLELIAAHQEDVRNGRFPPPPFAKKSQAW